MTKEMTVLDWQVGWTDEPARTPVRFVAATVPGAVQLDWARAEGWGPYWYADNYLQYTWMADRYWIYRCRLPRMTLAAGERLFFVSCGVDYECEVRLNGRPCHRQAGIPPSRLISPRLPPRVAYWRLLSVPLHGARVNL